MQFTTTNTGHSIIKLKRGEHVLSTITAFCAEQGIQNAELRGIGAVEWVSCGYYDLFEQQYHFTQYDALVEVVSMMGNVMLKDGAPFVHVHAVFTNTKNEAFGGHVEEMRVGVTLEIILTPLESAVERQFDSDIGLFLMNCGR